MGSILESHNFPKEKVSRKVRELIEIERYHVLVKRGMEKIEAKKEAKFKSSWYFSTMSNGGYVDPLQQRRKKVGTEQDQKSSSIGSKILESESFVEQRRIYITFMEDIINESKNIIKNLMQSDIDWQPLFESPEMSDSFFKLIKDMFYNELPEWHRVHDQRQSILPKMMIPLTAYKVLTLDKYFCSKYFAEVKKGVTISPKKYSYFLKDVNGMSDLLHYVKEDAWLWNFIDIKCPLCKVKSLRIRMESDGTWKFICKNWKVHNSDKLFPANLLGKQLESLKSKFTAEAFLSNKGLKIPLD